MLRAKRNLPVSVSFVFSFFLRVKNFFPAPRELSAAPRHLASPAWPASSIHLPLLLGCPQGVQIAAKLLTNRMVHMAGPASKSIFEPDDPEDARLDAEAMKAY